MSKDIIADYRAVLENLDCFTCYLTADYLIFFEMQSHSITYHAQLTDFQAALAVTIYNHIIVGWYHEGSSHKLKATLQTKPRSFYEWTRMAQNFLENQISFSAENWHNYRILWENDFSAIA